MVYGVLTVHSYTKLTLNCLLKIFVIIIIHPILRIRYYCVTYQRYRPTHLSFVSITDKINATQTSLIGRFCGTIYPPSLRSTTRYMKLRFKTDDAIQFEGFYVVYRSVPYERKRDVWNATGCFISMSDSKEGMVNSSSIPKRFINDAQQHGVPLDCIFEISISNASQILLRFTELKLANPDDCDMDFIDIHQSSLEFHNRIRQYCGGSTNHSVVNSSKAILHFMSDPKKLDENVFNAYYTVLKRSSQCQGDSDFDCGDGTCIAADLVCNKRPNCINKIDELNCDGIGWKKTTLQSVIISVVVGIIVVGVLAVAICLTCNEKQISQPRRYFAPAPLHKAVATEEFGFGCTVDEMFARSKEEELGYFVRRVPGPIVENVPKSTLVRGHSSSELLDNSTVPNSTEHTNSLNRPRTSRPNGQAISAATPSPRTRSQSPSGRHHHRLHFREPVVVEADHSVNLHSSIRDGIAVYMYSPNTKRKLKRVAN
ncbi:neuropilin and tolloid-like protein 2 isoform X2 [Paramacrobiotus metropolitanus]|uniref:neuropilin and tolloid-like protein 2 isoform X2 n=1 Tax=Paramacrobiotus metropolitanus TaxID=2943436 RepID=UPI0024456D7B|nr:neuropilin and tolloid-like protein 2 isoform X2 [Paramacrobiotus metropolitanus]